MKYDPRKKLFYYNGRLEEYKQADYPSLHAILYQYDDNDEEFKIVDMSDAIYSKALAAIKSYAEKEEDFKMKPTMEYDPNKCIYRYDKSSKEYKVTDKEKVREYEHAYQWDTQSQQFVEVDMDDLCKEADNVNHPKHYTGCGIECIEAMQLMFTPQTVCGFCVCNAIKYLWRYKDKNGIEDIDKAWWYLNKATEINKNAGGSAFDNNMLFRVNKLYETVLARAEREETK